MPNFTIEKASNGTTLIICKTNTPIASVRCVIEAGSRHEIKEAGEYGVAHFLEHMFFKGTEQKSYEEINRILGRLGSPNAYTGNGRTVYRINTLPLLDRLRDSLEILTEMVYDSSIPAEELEKEKGTIVQEWQSREDQPMGYFFDRACELIAGPLAHATIGTKESIEGMTRDHLIKFKERMYNPNNMAFCIVGDVDEDRAMELLHKFVDDRKNLASEGNFERVTGEWQHTERTNLTHSSEQAIVSVWYPWWSNEQELELNLAPDIALNAMGGGMHSLIFDRVREKLGLAYSTGCFPDNEADVFTMGCYGLCEGEKASRVEEELKKVVDEVTSQGIDTLLFQTAMQNTQFGAVNGLQAIEGFSRFTVDRYFATCRYRGSSYDTPASLIERLQKVEQNDIKKCLDIVRGTVPLVLTQNAKG